MRRVPVFVQFRLLVLSCVFAWLLAASPAFAQSDVSKWGVKVSGIPSWTMHDQVKDLLNDDEDTEINIEGSEFTIGFVRGSRLGGDWGVSYVRKPFKDGSGEIEQQEVCFNQAQTICRPFRESTLTQDVVLSGVEVHWFMRIANIKELVQVGLNFAGGIAQTKGQVVRTTDRFEPTSFNQQGPTAFKEIHEEEVLDAKDELFPYFPQGKVEAAASVILGSRAKVQVFYGLNFPAYAARIAGVVFF